jgi:hypothetical protein
MSPAGPAGPAGPMSPAGPAGPAGPIWTHSIARSLGEQGAHRLCRKAGRLTFYRGHCSAGWRGGVGFCLIPLALISSANAAAESMRAIGRMMAYEPGAERFTLVPGGVLQHPGEHGKGRERKSPAGAGHRRIFRGRRMRLRNSPGVCTMPGLSLMHRCLILLDFVLRRANPTVRTLHARGMPSGPRPLLPSP